MIDRDRHLTGLVAPPHAPMHADGSVNLDAVEGYAALLAANGLIGVFACGTTGEFFSLTLEERMRITERWIAVSKGALRVIVHVGTTCLADARALAEHAQQNGAWATAAVAPYYLRPACVDDLVEFCAGVAAAAPELPFYYYHIPAMSGVDIKVADFLARARDRIPNLAGAKFACEDAMDFGRCVRLEGGAFNMLFGRDEILLAALAHGARGGVGTTYNYAAPLYLDLIRAYDAGDIDEARSLQAKSADMIVLIRRCGGPLVVGKAVMRMLGIDCGPVRSPAGGPSEQTVAGLRAELERMGFFEFCTKGPS